MLTIPQVKPQLVMNHQIPEDSGYQGLKIVRVQTDAVAKERFDANSYEFQHQHGDYTVLRATLCRKGVTSDINLEKQRVVIMVHPTLKMFTEVVKYDPSNPPKENYSALEMLQAHDVTQSDFKGQKSANKEMFKNYILEGVYGTRPLFLPVISGWQSKSVFSKTIFVAYDEDDGDAMYGFAYLPKSPVMQSDGQTQTAALFAVADTKEAIDKNVLDHLRVTLEIELNVDERKAGQSFADRNGRGSKKNRNLVIALNTAEPISDLRVRAAADTIFEKRIADGRSTGTTETSTKNIVDLSTMEQMLLGALTNNKYKPEQLKHFHVDVLLPYAREFLLMLQELFENQWPETTPVKQDPFRKIFVHGWAFALKGIALAYYETRIDKLGPIAIAIAVKDASKTQEEAFKQTIAEETVKWEKEPSLALSELIKRLKQIDWSRYRRHWIALTGHKVNKDGTKKTFKLKSTSEEKVMGQAQNTPAAISAVKNKILSSNWTDLTSNEDEKA
jgi:hypothetical protein